MDAEPVLKRFNNRTSRQGHDSELRDSSGSNIPKQLVSLWEAFVEDGAKERTKELLERVEALQVKNKLLREEHLGLQEALNTKKKHKTKRNTLDLQQREEYHGSSVFWSSRKVREGRARSCETRRSRATATPENSR